MHNETWKSAGKKNEYQWLPPGKGVDWTEGPLVQQLYETVQKLPRKSSNWDWPLWPL